MTGQLPGNGQSPGNGQPSGRDAILGRLRGTIQRRSRDDTPTTAMNHPGSFQGQRPNSHSFEDDARSVLDYFRMMFELSGGEVVELPDEDAAAEWIRDLPGVESVCLGSGAPDPVPTLPKVEPHLADLGISRASKAIAETGTIVLDSRDGRRAQLLAPTHIVLVDALHLHKTLSDALASLASDLPSALGLHSGPSKSADIGQVMVRGVHGPGRIIAIVLGS